MKSREKVTAFDFENAFKALSEMEIPKVESRRKNLSERFIRSNVTNALMEDYYNVSDTNDLANAQDTRKEEIAQAKLARIEKIVDLNAETPEDILPSYVGKNIIQCPQCMTLFYKDQADIEVSEEDNSTCNVSEICQHCGNDSGYTLIGKVAAVEEPAEEEPIENEENSLNVEPVEETEEENTEESDLEVIPEEETENTEESEESDLEEIQVEESLHLNETMNLAEDADEVDKEALKAAIGEAFGKNGDKEKITNAIIDNIDKKDVDKVFDLIEKHLGNVNLNKEQVQKIIDKLPDDYKEKAKAQNWAKVKSICDFIDITPELKNNPEAFLWVVKTVLLVAAVACPADGPVLDIIAAIIMLIPNNIIGKIWAALAQFNPIIAAAKLGSKIAGDKIEDNVEKAGLGEGIIGDTIRGAVKGFLGEDAEDTLTEAVDKELDNKLKAHNDYIEYLKTEIEKTEKELENAKNEFVKKSIETRLDSLKADLEAALPEALKDEVQNELPAADEIEEVKESLSESFREEATQDKVLRKNEFYLGDQQDIFSGYYDSKDRWNGWANPGFEKDEAERLAEVINTSNNKEILKYDANLDAFLEYDEATYEDEESAQYVGKDCDTEDGIKHLYFIGAYGWIWCEKEETFEENLKEESAKELLQDFADSLGEDLEAEEKLAKFEQTLELDESGKKDYEEPSEEDAINSRFGPIRVSKEDAKLREKFVDDVSSEEFKSMLNNPVYYEEIEEEFEELDECSLNEHISKYLTNVYKNVKSFEATNCAYENNKLIVEGIIKFNSGSINKTKFEFLKESNAFIGENKDLCKGLNFTLNYTNKNKTIITESFKYKYNIGKKVVKGIIKK